MASRLSRPRLSRRRKLLFSLATFLILGGLWEGALALLGVPDLQSAADLWPSQTGGGTLFVREGDRYVTRPSKRTYFNPQSFSAEKGANTFRIFCLGGSTTFGHPYADAKSYVGILRELLRRSAPETSWEVVNCGGISYASYRLAGLMPELSRYQPDLFIIYTGQNEFLEERTFREERQQSAARKFAQRLVSRTRTATLFARWFQPEREADPLLATEVDAILDRTAGPARYHRDLPLKRAVVEQYGESLTAMCVLARACGADVLFVNPASNLRFSPFKSEHDAGRFGESLQVDVLLGNARRLRQAGDAAAALADLESAGQLEPSYAETWFQLGESRFAGGDYAAAEADYRRAIDEDVCALRAISELHSVLRGVAAEEAKPLVDFEALAAADSRARGGQGVPGSESFLDHVHPRPELHFRLALEVLDVLHHGSPDRFPAHERVAQIEPDVHQSSIEHSSPHEEALALCNLAQLLTWGGKVVEAMPLAEQAVALAPNDVWILCQYARLLDKLGRRDEARRAYTRAVALAPNDPLANYRLGELLLGDGDLSAAERHLAIAREHLPDGAPLAIREGLRRALDEVSLRLPAPGGAVR